MRPDRTYGPVPWYVVGWSLRLGGRAFAFCRLNTGDAYDGFVVLRGAGKRVVMVIGMYSYVHPLSDGSLLVWQPDAVPAGKSPRHLRFTRLRASDLSPIADVRKACRSIDQGRSALVVASTPSDVFQIPLALDAGMHVVDVPDWLRLDHEILMLVNSGAGRSRTVWSLAPRGERLEVLPQDWFNEGDFDFGYEWITRIGRDGKGRLVGDGIRIGPFRLDATGRQRAAWLKSSPLDD